MTSEQIRYYLEQGQSIRCMMRQSSRYPMNPVGMGKIIGYLERLDAFRVERDGQPNPKWLYEAEALTALYPIESKFPNQNPVTYGE